MKALITSVGFIASTLALSDTPWKALDEKGYQELSFADIPPTRYQLADGVLSAQVERSASAYLLPLSQAKVVSRLNFEWQSSLPALGTDAEFEAKKKGDDALLRLGLLLEGPAPTIPFFASAWIKAVAKMMQLPSDRMLYLAVGARHPAGSRWPSPYASSIENIALASTPASAGWQQASFSSPKPLRVVGLWIMADGDDTKASFDIKMRQLELTL